MLKWEMLKNEKLLKKMFLCFILVLFSGVTKKISAGGISSPNASMYLGNLKIGQSYSLQQLLGYPFTIRYRGRSMADISIKLRVPEKTTSDGFEPLPDTNWITIEKTAFSLDPGQTGETDIKIRIPNDEKLMGKKFIVQINPEASAPKDSGPGLALGVGLLCNLKIEISPKPPTAEEVRQLKQKLLGASIEVMVTPQRLFFAPVPVGKKINTKRDYGEVIKIVNSSNFNLDVNIQAIPAARYGMSAPEGYDEIPDFSWIKIAPQKVSVAKNTVREIQIFLFIPDKEEFKKRKFYSVISVLVESKIRSVSNFVRLYIETE